MSMTSSGAEELSERYDNTTDHLTVLCSVARPLNKSEAGVDLALIRISVLLYIEYTKKRKLRLRLITKYLGRMFNLST